MKNGKHVILCVDDDSDILESLKAVLEANNYVVVASRTAEEGFKKFQSDQPDLIIVDLMMEEVDAGTTLVTRLRAAGNAAPNRSGRWVSHAPTSNPPLLPPKIASFRDVV